MLGRQRLIQKVENVFTCVVAARIEVFAIVQQTFELRNGRIHRNDMQQIERLIIPQTNIQVLQILWFLLLDPFSPL